MEMAAVHEAPTKVLVNIGGYTVDFMGELGHGAFGVVYQAEDRAHHPMAVKKVSPIREHDEERVILNAVGLKIEHRHVVKISGALSFKGSVWVAMEFCDLGNLDDFFRGGHGRSECTEELQSCREKRSRFDDKIRLMTQIAEGLSYLHSRAIVHRDIKPTNVLLKREPGRNQAVVKLADFGLSRIMDPDGMTSVMSCGVGVGAAHFMAPEFWTRTPGLNVGYRRNVDVFAMGLTFLAMLQYQNERHLVPKPEGQLEPFEKALPIGLILARRMADLIQSTVHAAIADIFQAMQEHYCKIDIVVRLKDDEDDGKKALKDLVRNMTRVNPEERPTAADVLTQIKVLLGGKSSDIVLA